MELEIRPVDPEEKSYRISVILLGILILFVVVLQSWGARVHHRVDGVESSERTKAITSGDMYAKCWVAWPSHLFADYTLRSYELALPWPSAYRRVGVMKESLGQSGLAEIKRIDLPKTLHGLDLSKKQIAKLHSEKKMWLRIYGPDKLTADEARDYASEIRKLNLGPLKEVAVAYAYRKAGLSKTAERIADSVRTEFQTTLILAGCLIALLMVGGIGGLGIAIVFLVMIAPRLNSAPLSHIRPSALITCFIVYLASYIGLGAAGQLLGDLVGVDLASSSAGVLYMGMMIVAAAAAYAIGLKALVARTRPGESWREIGYRTVSAGRDALWGVAGYLASLPFVTTAAMVSFLLTSTLLKHFPTPEQPFGEMVSKGSPLEIALVFIGASVVAPIVEETFFRGALYTAFRGRMGIWPSIALTSALFAVIHPLPGGFLPIFTLACVLALLRERSGSLLPGMVCHSVYNTVGLIIAGLLF